MAEKEKILFGEPCYKIRTLEEKNIPQMRDLFRSTVLNVNIRDYTKEEVEDWASCGENLKHLKELLSYNQFVGAFDEHDALVGFASMNKDGYLHSMFVHGVSPTFTTNVTLRLYFHRNIHKLNL